MFALFRDDVRLRRIALISLGTTIGGFFFIVLFGSVQKVNVLALTGDSKGYVLLAQNMLEHNVFSLSDPPYAPESFRSPGYPTFLAGLFLIFGFSLVALFVHALIMSAAPLLAYVLFRPYHERAAFWGATIFAFEPVRIYLSSSFLSDAFFSVLFLASLVSLERGREKKSYAWVVVSGLLVGALILVRPIALFIPLLFAGYYVFRVPSRQGLISACIVGIVSAITIFPWLLRNHMVFDSWNLSSVGAANLVLYNAPEFLTWRPDPHGQSVLDAFNTEQSSLPRSEALSLRRNPVFTATFRDVINGHEVQYVFFHVVKTVPFFLSDGLRDTVRLFKVDIGSMPNISTAIMTGDMMSLVSYVRSGGIAIMLLLLGSGFWTIVTLGWIGASVRAIIRREWLPILFMSALIMYFALLTGPVSNARYRLPIEALMITLAVTFFYRWYDARHDRV